MHVYIYIYICTETEMLSFWWNFHHWLHWKLSFWQLSVQPVMKISSKRRHFRFSVCQQTGSDNGLPPDWRQAIIWKNAGILLIGPLETNFSEIVIKIHTLSFKKMHLKMSSGKWRPFCLGLNVLSKQVWTYGWLEPRESWVMKVYLKMFFFFFSLIIIWKCE